MRNVDMGRARRLRQTRLRRGMTHMDLAIEAHISSVNTISNLENGHTRGHKSTWAAIEQILGPIPATPRKTQQRAAG
jgi:transcriptional regulator with XRE-family HTH domain